MISIKFLFETPESIEEADEKIRELREAQRQVSDMLKAHNVRHADGSRMNSFNYYNYRDDLLKSRRTILNVVDQYEAWKRKAKAEGCPNLFKCINVNQLEHAVWLAQKLFAAILPELEDDLDDEEAGIYQDFCNSVLDNPRISKATKESAIDTMKEIEND